MSFLSYKRLWLVLAIGVPMGLSSRAAEPPARPAVVAAPMPPARSPIDSFRELLAMNPAEQRTFLANRPPESQKRILAKLQEYQALKPEERELRLRATELHYYLMQFLGTAATNRAVQLQFVPAQIRALVADRLEQWDSLPADLKQKLLENERMLDYFTTRTVQLPTRPGAVPQPPPGNQEQLDEAVRRWQSFSREEKGAIIKNFKKVFELSPEEKTNVLAALSEPERRQIEKSLQSFAGLTPPQKAQCMRSFDKLANLTPEDLRQFLKDAGRWESMSPSDRQTWRDLVYNLSHLPPLPPGMGGPPLPPRSPPIDTNRHNLTTNERH